jgi:hypothetical protein
LVPIIGTNTQDVDGNYHPMGQYLGPTNVKQFFEKNETDFYGELITFSERRHIHISSGVPKVTGDSVISTSDPNDFFFQIDHIDLQIILGLKFMKYVYWKIH